MPSCIFCKIVAGELSSSKVYEDVDVLGFLDIIPVNPGHTLIIPKKHFESIHDTPDELVAKMSIVAKKIATAVQQSLGAKGVNIGMNNGVHAGQEVFHAHVHVMPRYGKDSFKLWEGTPDKAAEREMVAEKIHQYLSS